MFTSPNEPGSGTNWIAFCVIQSKSSNISRHQIFTEGDTAQVRQSHSGRQDRASLSSGSLWSSREEVQKTPQLLCKVPSVLLGEAGCWRGRADTGELAYLAQGTVHRCINLEQKVTCLWAINWSSIFMRIWETVDYFTLSGKTLVWVPIFVHGLLSPFWDCDLFNSHTCWLHGHPKPTHCLR